jgi:hypothetical protein
MNTEEIILRNRLACLAECSNFSKVFKERLINYWDGNVLGLDILKFENFIKPNENESLSDAILRLYGSEGVRIIETLLGIEK